MKVFLTTLASLLATQQRHHVSAFNIAPSQAHLASRQTVSTGYNVGPLIVSVPKATEAEVSDEPNTKIEGRRNRVIMGYKAIIAAYAAVAAFVLMKAGPTLFSFVFAFGNVSLPAGIAYILISAAEHDRLKSNTYKRLNLALFQYGVIGLSTVVIVPARRGNPLLYLPFLLSCINSVKGYTYGVLGWNKKNGEVSLVQDFLTGPKDVITGLLSVPMSVKSFGYLGATATIGALNLWKAADIFKYLQAGKNLAGITPLLSQFIRLSLLATVMYTLKDASDRNRLNGTTFIQLNFLAATFLAANSLYLGALTTQLGRAAAACAAFLAGNGLASKLEREHA